MFGDQPIPRAVDVNSLVGVVQPLLQCSKLCLHAANASEDTFLLMRLLAASVRQAVALSAAEITRTGGQMQTAGSPIARRAIDDQRASEPPPLATELRRRALQPHWDSDVFGIPQAVMQRNDRRVTTGYEIVDGGLAAAAPGPDESAGRAGMNSAAQIRHGQR